MEASTRPNSRKSPSKQLQSKIRWLHLYLSMIGFAALVFFSITGITLNHPDWFYASTEKTTEYSGTLPKEWIPSGNLSSEARDSSAPIDKLSIVEQFRSDHGIRGAVKEFSIEEYEIIVGFASPGYLADALIERADRSYTISETSFGALAVMNDLHKGRDTGLVWSWVIDLTAIIMLVVSISGFFMLLSLRNRKTSGFVTAVAGAFLLVFAYLLWVP